MTAITRALHSGDPYEMVCAVLERQQSDGYPRDFEKAIRATLIALSYDWDGTPTGLTPESVRAVCALRGLTE